MRKKIDSRVSDTRRTKSSGNVFVDLGFDPAEAKVMALRAEVMIRIEQHLKAQGWTQAEAARRLGITQPRVSRLIKGQWQDFSLDMLLTLAAGAGLRPELTLAGLNQMPTRSRLRHAGSSTARLIRGIKRGCRYLGCAAGSAPGSSTRIAPGDANAEASASTKIRPSGASTTSRIRVPISVSMRSS